MKHRTRVLATAVAALVTATVVAGPAYAEKQRYADPADATASLTDIRSVVVDHRVGQLVVKIRFTDLRRNSTGGPAGLTMLIDTRSDRAGAEFRLTTGLQSGTDFQLMKVRGGRAVGEPLTCAHHLRLDFAEDRLSFGAARTCLGMPGSVRIGVKMRDDFDGSHPVVDWLGEPRSMTTPRLRSS
jgi:hypothetical protein